jgi:hypothetical protein
MFAAVVSKSAFLLDVINAHDVIYFGRVFPRFVPGGQTVQDLPCGDVT